MNFYTQTKHLTRDSLVQAATSLLCRICPDYISGMACRHENDCIAILDTLDIAISFVDNAQAWR